MFRATVCGIDEGGSLDLKSYEMDDLLPTSGGRHRGVTSRHDCRDTDPPAPLLSITKPPHAHAARRTRKLVCRHRLRRPLSRCSPPFWRSFLLPRKLPPLRKPVVSLLFRTLFFDGQSSANPSDIVQREVLYALPQQSSADSHPHQLVCRGGLCSAVGGHDESVLTQIGND